MAAAAVARRQLRRLQQRRQGWRPRRQQGRRPLTSSREQRRFSATWIRANRKSSSCCCCTSGCSAGSGAGSSSNQGCRSDAWHVTVRESIQWLMRVWQRHDSQQCQGAIAAGGALRRNAGRLQQYCSVVFSSILLLLGWACAIGACFLASML